jgi:hypothetical protein
MEEDRDIIQEMLNFKPKIWQKIWWPTRRFIKSLPEKPRDVKHWFQRASRGYDDTSYYGVDYHIVKIIIPILKDLRENCHGYPGYGGMTIEKWEKILDRMILGWEAAKRVCDDEYYLKTGFPEKRFEGDTKIWHKAMKKDIKRFEKMMPLFTKYFFNLWD